MTTIVLADDHPFVRQGLRAVLQAEKEFQLLGEAEMALMPCAWLNDCARRC